MKPLFLPSVVYFGIPMGLLGTAMNGLHLQQMLSIDTQMINWLIWYGCEVTPKCWTPTLGVFSCPNTIENLNWRLPSNTSVMNPVVRFP
ncbi:MAG: hypothetical protein U9R28_04685, partial [Pseudomonadota bacterium]|nr:hypothetical protein [Pseudomonadota bacterium]